MWWTPDGERILQGAEAGLFKEALGVTVDMVREDDEGFLEFAAPPFDALQPNQKLAVLAQVGAALLREDQPMPKPSAVLEAAVGAVYETVRVMVAIEIDEPVENRESPRWRELVLAACRERGIEELLDPESEDLGEWEVLISCLADGVLWDEDYYIAVPPDPTDEEMEGIWASLRRLTSDGS